MDTPLPGFNAKINYVSSQLENIQHTISVLSEGVIGYLKDGGVVVVLCSHRGAEYGDKFKGNLEWLAETFDFDYSILESPAPVIQPTEIGPVRSYLEYVDTTRVCLGGFAPPVQPLAQTDSEECNPAVLLEAYLDPSLTKRDFDGKIVFLPRPRSFAPISVPVARRLLEIIDYFSPKSVGPDQASLLEFDTPSIEQQVYDEQLDEDLEASCVSKVRRGEHSDAIAAAGKILGERVRNADSEKLGGLTSTELMEQAFRRGGGAFRWAEEDNEQKGLMFLYAGAIAAMRNPMSHRNPDPERGRFLDDVDATVAMRYIVFVDLLLKMLDRYETPEEGGEE
ncbi:TIGR02391 family protein [Haloplanus rallus]|uniref:TIGR02391 family protein n=1 Tax=Haloplanus rallus TaxID=1816183 RepID=UPI0012FE4FE3|nr:TIGR02391 family protein [Haloplanus rallus]